MSPGDERQLVGFGSSDGAIHIYPFGELSPIARLEGLQSPVTALAFTLDQRSVLGGSDEGVLRLWDLATEKCTGLFEKRHQGAITDISVDNLGSYVATVSADTHLRMWSIRTSKCVQTYKGSETRLYTVRFSPDGSLVATGGEGGLIQIYDLRKEKIAARLELHTQPVRTLCFHSHKSFLAVGCDDGTMSVWNTETGEVQFHARALMNPVNVVQFCRNRILVASKKRLQVYNVDQLSDSRAVLHEARWTRLDDLNFKPFLDEAWFVEAHHTTALTGRIPIMDRTSATSGPPPQFKSNKSTTHVNTFPNHKLQTGSSRAAANITASPNSTFAATSERTKLPGNNYVMNKPQSSPLIPVSTAVPPPRPRSTLTIPRPPVVNEELGEEELVDDLLHSSSETEGILHRRLTQMQVLRSLWVQDQRAAFQHLARVCEEGDGGVVLDFLSAMQQQRMKEKLTTETMPDLFGIIYAALGCPKDEVVLMALRTMRSTVTKLRVKRTEDQRRARMYQSKGTTDQFASVQDWEAELEECSVAVLALSNRRDSVGDEARQLLRDLPSPPRGSK